MNFHKIGYTYKWTDKPEIKQTSTEKHDLLKVNRVNLT